MEGQIQSQQDGRLLVYQNEREIQRITNELETRLSILKKLNDVGLNPDQVKAITTSQATIDQYIFDLQLRGNKELAKLHKAGITVAAELPSELQELKYTLTAWLNYPAQIRGGNKFSGLVHTGSEWDIDSQQVERHFEAQGLKVYVQDERLAEYRDYETLVSILIRRGMYHGQVFQTPWLNERIENTSKGLVVRGTFFRPS